MNRKKVLLVTCLLFLTVIFFVSAEIILRVKGFKPWKVVPVDIIVEPGDKFFKKHPVLGYSHIPGTFDVILKKSYKFRVTHLPNTLRITQPLDSIGIPAKPEIWIFGGSYTHGWSLNDDETYSWLLQKRHPDYKIVNYGVSGYGTIHALLQFKEALRVNKPKMAILAYASFHDERNTYLRNRRKSTAPWNKLGPLIQPYARLDRKGKLRYRKTNVEYQEFPLMRKSAFIHFIEQIYNAFEKRFFRSHVVSKKLILEMARIADEFDVIFVVAGISNDVNTKKMLSFLQKKGINTVDISVDLDKKGYRNIPYDSHPSALANEKYADNLSIYLKSILSYLH